MTIDKKNRAIGEWYLEGTETFFEVDFSLLEKMTQQLLSIIKVLAQENLYHPGQFILKGWVSSDPSGENVPDKNKKVVIDMTEKTSLELAETFLDEVNTQLKDMRCFPGMIDCLGSGVIHSADGAHHIAENLMWLSIDIVAGYVFTLHTQSDVWMPCDIKGNSQPDTHKLNAPRLEKAFRAIEKATGLPIETDEEPTRYARPVRYALENFTNNNGEPLDVISTFGIDIK